MLCICFPPWKLNGWVFTEKKSIQTYPKSGKNIIWTIHWFTIFFRVLLLHLGVWLLHLRQGPRFRGYKTGYEYEILPTFGPQHHEKWRFYTPNIWVITPKNEGCGFPYQLYQGSISLSQYNQGFLCTWMIFSGFPWLDVPGWTEVKLGSNG